MTERELFEAWWDKAKHTLKCEYYDSYEIWQASASRDGYKLVPVEPSDKMKLAAYKQYDAGLSSMTDIYKAMIGVVE